MRLSFLEFLLLLLVAMIIATVFVAGLFFVIEWSYSYLKLQ